MEVLFTNPATGDKENFLYQWDTNIDFTFEIENGVSVEAVFSVMGMREGIRKECTNTLDNTWTCKVPDTVLQYGTDIRVFVTYLNNGRKVVDLVIIPVYKQTKPAGYVVTTDDKYTTIEELLEIVAQAKKETQEAAQLAERYAVGREDIPESLKGNAKYYAGQAKDAAAEIPGKVAEAKDSIDQYVSGKEAELKGDTGNVYFAAFKVVNGRLKMYSDPNVDKVRFIREGSRLKYRLTF